ncbi:MAG: cell division protein FtsK [Thalassolituus sp.]|nr:MAG: cell division protein FtsK [Thalassolituus sp.]
MAPQQSEIDTVEEDAAIRGWRKRHDIAFLLLSLGCILLFLALVSYDPEDVAWSVVGTGQAENSIGQVGAYLADFLLHGLGYLAFAFPTLILAKTWLLFRKAPALEGRVWVLRASGLLLTLITLAALAHVSIWSGDALPAGAGGIVGEGLNLLLQPLFGFVGTTVILLIGLALGLVLFLEFSWLMFFERLGGKALALVSTFNSKRQKDLAAGDDVTAKAESPSTPESTLQDDAMSGVDLSENWASKGGLLSRLFRKRGSAQDKKRVETHDGVEPQSNAEQHNNTGQQVDADPLGGLSGFNALDDDDFQVEAQRGASVQPSQLGTLGSVRSEASGSKRESLKARASDIDGAAADSDFIDVPWQEEPKRTNANASVAVSEAEQSASEPVKSIKIEPLEKRDSAPSDRAKRDLQGSLFKGSEPLPSIALLDPPKQDGKAGFSEDRLRDLSELLVQKLADFGVKIEVAAVAPGPVITRFEIQPAPGVKASKISNLAKDLARSMAMVAVRVVEVIPGKSVMGIEVPNENRAMVTLGEVLSSQDYDKSKSPLTLALGHDIAGNPIITDLAKMPHLLVAGTTGSGKSVGVNAMLLSLLFKSTPDELRLILVDPKMLELSVYEGIPHLLTPVITDMKEAASGLRWSVAEMERRYQLMAAMGVRNIAGFNKKVKDAIEAGQPLADPLWQIDQSFDTTPPTLEPLPYIVIVVDEFADMMMMVGKKVEELIARIAQKARAAGIHMILATQRPSVDVITGLIKANVPTRIAFQVSSKIDSRTILDQGGAEQLLGHGDMLYMPPGNALPERVHGAFVDDDEVHRVVAEWKQRGEPDYLEEITQVGEDGSLPGAGGDDGDGEKDDLYDQAVAFVTESGKCSISSVQRKLRIGYNRAARLVETMESAGVVSPPAHNGSREVIAPPPS